MKYSLLCFAGIAITISSADAIAGEYHVPRLSDGTPDLQGVWTNSTATPLERSLALGNRRTYTDAEVAKIEGTARARVENDSKPTDPNAKIAAGNLPPVGNYNQFWTDRGMSVAVINGEKRTSMIIDPPNGRIPPLTPQAQKRLEKLFPGRAAQAARIAGNLGEAFTGPSGFPGAGNSEESGEGLGPVQAGPAEGPEQRGLGERCIIGFGSTSGPPMLPTMYNSYYQIYQSPGYVMILVEMVHDTRIIRIDGKPLPKSIKRWMGDSVGHWEGDTLVVKTTNFRSEQSYRGTSENAVITERFTRVADDKIVYRFTIDDPASFTAKFTGELPFTSVSGNVYEYACHEGNYALPAILAGARAAEKQSAQVNKQ
ncbi:MAG TPA: hypothetical protein VET48_08680 [Steroidobacteraceae bacterium]|nr:hypothetical protein [Steroidobacteraceae bacterium]